MPNLSIKDVPEPWAEALRQRAALNHRSLQGELMALIGQAVQGSHWQSPLPIAIPPVQASSGQVLADPGRVSGVDRFGHPVVRRGWKTAEQLAAEMRALPVAPSTGQLSSIDIIRQDRDTR